MEHDYYDGGVDGYWDWSWDHCEITKWSVLKINEVNKRKINERKNWRLKKNWDQIKE